MRDRSSGVECRLISYARARSGSGAYAVSAPSPAAASAAPSPATPSPAAFAATGTASTARQLGCERANKLLLQSWGDPRGATGWAALGGVRGRMQGGIVALMSDRTAPTPDLPSHPPFVQELCASTDGCTAITVSSNGSPVGCRMRKQVTYVIEPSRGKAHYNQSPRKQVSLADCFVAPKWSHSNVFHTHVHRSSG